MKQILSKQRSTVSMQFMVVACNRHVAVGNNMFSTLLTKRCMPSLVMDARVKNDLKPLPRSEPVTAMMGDNTIYPVNTIGLIK